MSLLGDAGGAGGLLGGAGSQKEKAPQLQEDPPETLLRP